MGPSLLFDKSFLQGLSVDEAAMLDQLYQCIITPIFYIETLADLAKEENAKRPPEKVVGGLAERTPVCHSAVNATHWAVAMDSLAGSNIPLDGRPAVAGGIPVEVEGKSGVVFERSPETEAFARWQQGQFEVLERVFAGRWRASLAALDLAAIAAAFRSLLRREDRPKNLEEAKAQAGRLMDAGGMNFRGLQLAIHMLGVPPTAIPGLVTRWKAAGHKPLREYAPYAAHCLEVDLFFFLAMSNGLISDQRASNLVDIAYLYYLPFAQVFASSDKLHRRIIPLFMTEKQVFIWGLDLKDDLARANAHFAGLPDEERAKGLFLLASEPHPDSDVIASHWDQFRSGWRTRKAVPLPAKDSDAHEKIMAASNAFMDAANARKLAPVPDGELDHLIIQRFIPRTRGKWQMFSKEVEEAEDREG